MTEFEAASLAISQAGLSASYIGLGIAAGNMVAAIIAAVGIWVFGIGMKRANENRAEAEKNRHEQIMAAFKDAAEDRKAAQADAAEARKAAQADAAEARKVTDGLLAVLKDQGAALERQGAALEKLINRTDAVVVELQRHQGPGARPRRRA